MMYYYLLISVSVMSEDQLKAFLEAVKSDAVLQEKLSAAADLDAVVEIAKDVGFMISAEELQRAKEEVSDEELEGVAGGSMLIATVMLTTVATAAGVGVVGGGMAFGAIKNRKDKS